MSIHDEIRQEIRNIIEANATADILSPTFVANKTYARFGSLDDEPHVHHNAPSNTSKQPARRELGWENLMRTAKPTTRIKATYVPRACCKNAYPIPTPKRWRSAVLAIPVARSPTSLAMEHHGVGKISRRAHATRDRVAYVSRSQDGGVVSFVKIFPSIYDGTLVEHWQALVTFQQMIILCDENGIVDMTPYAIHGRTGIPLEIIRAGIPVLEAPDPASRSPAMQGRRIARLDETREWGWFLVNYADYRHKRSVEEKREADRLRVAGKRADVAASREASQRVAGSRDASGEVANVAQGEGEGDRDRSRASTPFQGVEVGTEVPTSAPAAKKKEKKAKAPPCPIAAIVDLYHAKLPKLPRVEKITPGREGYVRQRWHEDLPTLDHWANYFDDVAQSDFLMGRSRALGDRPPFRADFEWLCRPSNFAKVAEGKYHHG